MTSQSREKCVLLNSVLGNTSTVDLVDKILLSVEEFGSAVKDKQIYNDQYKIKNIFITH